MRSSFRALVGATLCVLSPTVFAAALSFAAVRDSSLPLAEFQSGSYSYTQSQQNQGATLAPVVNAAIASGSARAETSLGVNRAAASNNTIVDDEGLRASSIGGPFAVGISAWTDTFTISGGTGAGVLNVSSRVTWNFGAGLGAAGIYALFVATPQEVAALFAKPFEFAIGELNLDTAALALNQYNAFPQYSDAGERVGSNVQTDRTLTGTVGFTYGQSFQLVSVLVTAANDTGSIDAFNTALFGITAPTNASIVTGSGTVYRAAATARVPEPATLALVLVAIGGVARLRWRASKG